MPRLLRRVTALAATGGLAGAILLAAPVAAVGTSQTYLVVYKATPDAAKVSRAVRDAGGTLVANYNQIGVAVVRSANTGFQVKMKGDSNVASVAATAGSAVRLDKDAGADATQTTTSAPATDTDSLSGLQWDMVQIHTPEAHAISGGSPAVLVGDIDTGLDYTHPDLAANVDNAASANCLSGAPVQGMVAANDDNGHGTHTAGTIAAAANGIGIVGVAPNVKIAGIKAGNADGFFFPEAVVCAFMWAGDHGIDVTNNSYFADPWYFNCQNDPDQRAIYEAERRAIKYAQKQGVLVVAAAGNFSDDLDHPTLDDQSPDNGTPIENRPVTDACKVVPTEVEGVVGVSANGNLGLKSFYSSYGHDGVDVVAPGGDSILQRTAAAPNGRVLSTWPASLLTSTCLAARRLVDASGATYCYQQGTSMASPHVAGIAALIQSQHPNWKPNKVAAAIRSTADPLACPADMSIYAPFPSVNNDAPQVCHGGTKDNTFNGHGQVNALSAVNE